MQLLLTVNGMLHEVEAKPTARLIDVLRDQLGLTGTKESCGEGECGACTVIVDGKAVNSCLMLAVQARGREVLTVESLAQDGQLDLLQRKFVEHGAVQCGYCTPGMLMAAKALLMANPLPSEQDIRMALAGNLCRCTGYTTIVAAVKAASGQETPVMELPAEGEDLVTAESSPDVEAEVIAKAAAGDVRPGARPAAPAAPADSVSSRAAAPGEVPAAAPPDDAPAGEGGE